MSLSTIGRGVGLSGFPMLKSMTSTPCWRNLSASATTAMVAVVAPLPALGGLPELAIKAGVGAFVYGALVWAIDAGGLRSRAGHALQILRRGAVA